MLVLVVLIINWAFQQVLIPTAAETALILMHLFSSHHLCRVGKVTEAKQIACGSEGNLCKEGKWNIHCKTAASSLASLLEQLFFPVGKKPNPVIKILKSWCGKQASRRRNDLIIVHTSQKSRPQLAVASGGLWASGNSWGDRGEFSCRSWCAGSSSICVVHLLYKCACHHRNSWMIGEVFCFAFNNWWSGMCGRWGKFKMKFQTGRDSLEIQSCSK